MKSLVGFAIAFVAACGGGGGEEIGGEMTIDWGPVHVVPDSGAAIELPDAQVPGTLIIGIGDLDFGCGWGDDRIRPGTFFAFTLEPSEQAPGTYSPFMSVTHVDDDGVHSNATSGELVLTAFGERIAGRVTFSTNDDEVGAVTASGTFDVINCL